MGYLLDCSESMLLKEVLEYLKRKRKKVVTKVYIEKRLKRLSKINANREIRQ